MQSQWDRRFRLDVRRNILAGLTSLLPVIITLVLLGWLYGVVEGLVGKPFNGLCRAFLMFRPVRGIWLRLDPNAPANLSDTVAVERRLEQWYPEIAGTVLAFCIFVLLLYLTGMALRNLTGKRVWRWVDNTLVHFPVVRLIYPYAKELTDFLFGPRGSSLRFNRVVMVEWPRKGVYAVAFATGSGLSKYLAEQAESPNWVAVFVPNTPAPLTGFVVMVRADELLEIDMTVDEALRFIVSAGVLVPDRFRQASPRTDSQADAVPPAVEGDSKAALHGDHDVKTDLQH